MKIKKILGITAICAVILYIPLFDLSSICLGQPEEPTAPEAIIEEPEPRISMDFKDASLKLILKLFSQQSGLNFIASEEIEDRTVTLYLDRVTVRDALDTIIKANRLTYEQAEGSDIFIVKELVVPEVETITRIYPFNFAKVKKVAELLRALAEMEAGWEGGSSTGILTKYGSVIADERTNSLIVTDIPGQFPVIEETIAKLDTRTPQVMIEVEILETSSDVAEKLGIRWGGLEGQIITYRGPFRDTAFPLSGYVSGATSHPDYGAGGGGGESGVDRGLVFGTLSMAEFSAVLSALITESETRYLARPRILTLNNEKAEIKISADMAVGISQVTTEEGVTAVEAERVEVGVLLKVTPQINEQGFITMTIEPEVSTVKPSVIATFYDPHMRSAKTTVMVRDGETIVIGGLIATEDKESIDKLPFLADLPLIGPIFKKKDARELENELVIFITPHIVKERFAPPAVETLQLEPIVVE